MKSILTGDVIDDNVIDGEFYIKGIIRVYNESGDFEVIDEDFFYTGLERNGCFLSQSDIDVYLENELTELDWGFKPLVGHHYSVLFKFTLEDNSCWTACGYEYDSSVECVDLHILPFTMDDNDIVLN